MQSQRPPQAELLVDTQLLFRCAQVCAGNLQIHRPQDLDKVVPLLEPRNVRTTHPQSWQTLQLMCEGSNFIDATIHTDQIAKALDHHAVLESRTDSLRQEAQVRPQLCWSLREPMPILLQQPREVRPILGIGVHVHVPLDGELQVCVPQVA